MDETAVDDQVEVPIFEIEINYKSGIRQRFWVYSFKISETRAAKNASWRYVEGPRPITMGIEDIESVWQLRTSTKLVSKELAEELSGDE